MKYQPKKCLYIEKHKFSNGSKGRNRTTLDVEAFAVKSDVVYLVYFFIFVRITAPWHHHSCGWTSKTCFTTTMGTAMSAPWLNVRVFPRQTIDVMVEQLRWRDGGHLRSERGGRRRDKKREKKKPGECPERGGKKKEKK